MSTDKNLLSVLNVEDVRGLVDPDDPVGRVDKEAFGSTSKLDAFHRSRAWGLLAYTKLWDNLKA